MAVSVEITTVYLDAQRCRVVTCSKCGIIQPAKRAHYTGALGGKVLKVKCASHAAVVGVRFEFRRHHRGAIQPPGTLLQRGTKYAFSVGGNGTHRTYTKGVPSSQLPVGAVW